MPTLPKGYAPATSESIPDNYHQAHHLIYCSRHPPDSLQVEAGTSTYAVLHILWSLVLKTVYEIIVLPVTIRVVRWVKAYEGEDVYDHGVCYNIFAVFKREFTV